VNSHSVNHAHGGLHMAGPVCHMAGCVHHTAAV